MHKRYSRVLITMVSQGPENFKSAAGAVTERGLWSPLTWADISLAVLPRAHCLISLGMESSPVNEAMNTLPLRAVLRIK